MDTLFVQQQQIKSNMIRQPPVGPKHTNKTFGIKKKKKKRFYVLF